MNKKLVIVPVLPGASSGVFTSQSARHGDNQIQEPGVRPILRQGYISLTNAGADQYIRDQDQARHRDWVTTLGTNQSTQPPSALSWPQQWPGSAPRPSWINILLLS